MRKELEKDIQKAVSIYLRTKGFTVLKFNNVGIYIKKTGRYIPPPRKGVSDLICCSPQGGFVAIEIKRKGNKLSEHQEAFIEEIRAIHGEAICVYSVDEIIDWYHGYEKRTCNSVQEL